MSWPQLERDVTHTRRETNVVGFLYRRLREYFEDVRVPTEGKSFWLYPTTVTPPLENLFTLDTSSRIIFFTQISFDRIFLRTCVVCIRSYSIQHTWEYCVRKCTRVYTYIFIMDTKNYTRDYFCWTIFVFVYYKLVLTRICKAKESVNYIAT